MLKTFSALILSLISTVAVNLHIGSAISFSGNHTVYLYSPSSNCKMLELEYGKERSFICLKSSFKGESVVLDDIEDKALILDYYRACPVFFETVGEIENEYYYSDKISAYTTVNGKKVNVHISRTGGKVAVGIPFIFGSY